MSEPTEKMMSEIQEIIDQYEIKLPKYWEELTWTQKLDFVGERILMGTRTSKKHSYLKEQGWLSSSQLERRKRREVYGRVDDFRDLNVKRGDPNRPYITAPLVDPAKAKLRFPITVITGVNTTTFSGGFIATFSGSTNG